MTTFDQWTVLIIDDEADIREVTSLTLLDAGYIVETAADGAEGLELCERFSPKIIITDVRMPVMDGIQVLETVKERFPDTEVIVATAFGEMEIAIRALQLDASDFITKPIHTDALMVSLKRARRRYSTRQQLKTYTSQLEQGLIRTTHQLEETVAYQHRLIESSMDGILGCDAEDRVVTFNRSMKKILGFDRTSVLHQFQLSNFFNEKDLYRLKEDLAAPNFGGTDRLLLYEIFLLNAEGEPVPVQLSATYLKENNETTGIVFFVRDLRRIHHLEQEMADQAKLLHQDKMMSLGRLAASVAHEINNPLAGILNYIRLMIRTVDKGTVSEDKSSQFSRYLKTVETETDRCSKIVSNLLTFSRHTPVSMQPVSANEILDRSLVLAKHRLKLANIQLTTQVPEQLPAVTGDANQLQQCLLNLIFNAIDAMPDGGALTISGNFSVDQKALVIRVTDTGHGIDKKDITRIFEPFFTTKTQGQGIGLGLSITYGILERHGGSLKAKSEQGKETTFEMTLPISGEAR